MEVLRTLFPFIAVLHERIILLQPPEHLIRLNSSLLRPVHDNLIIVSHRDLLVPGRTGYREAGKRSEDMIERLKKKRGDRHHPGGGWNNDENRILG